MTRYFVIGTALAFLATASVASHAAPQTKSVPETLAVQTVATEESLTEIVNWLAKSQGLPAIHQYPELRFAPAMELVAVRYPGLLSARIPGFNAPIPQALGIYDDRSRTIILADHLAGNEAALRSVLVHEMVHHLQNVGRLAYDCPAAREKAAYLAQDDWLQMHGTSLEAEFEVDLFTILVKSACNY